MTRVRYDRAGLRMQMEGHAGAGEYGRDMPEKMRSMAKKKGGKCGK